MEYNSIIKCLILLVRLSVINLYFLSLFCLVFFGIFCWCLILLVDEMEDISIVH